jgi:hypothetical protein
MRRKNLIWIAPLALAGLALFVFIGGEIVMQLWNRLLPGLFGFPTLSFWQALGLLVLCRILFGGFGGHRGGGGSGMRRRMKERMRERYARMTPEEQERFRRRMRERWGFEPASEKPGETGPTA